MTRVIESHMAKEHVSMDELQRALREHGVATYKEAAIAVLEVDGSISVLKYTTSSHRLDSPQPPPIPEEELSVSTSV